MTRLYPYLHSISAYADHIVDALDESSQQVLRSMPIAELASLHYSWGMDIRNEFGLWNSDHPLTKRWHEKPEERDIQNEVDHSIDHPDHISMEIMRGVWKKVNA